MNRGLRATRNRGKVSYVNNVRGDELGAGKGVISRTHVKISHKSASSAYWTSASSHQFNSILTSLRSVL